MKWLYNNIKLEKQNLKFKILILLKILKIFINILITFSICMVSNLTLAIHLHAPDLDL